MVMVMVMVMVMSKQYTRKPIEGYENMIDGDNLEEKALSRYCLGPKKT
ncbi:hypothetical protein [Legionella parisiensis]|nr:hypothetical protein [Legionella parisiensis]